MTPAWSAEAIGDLEAPRAHIEENDPAAAQRVASRIVHDVEVLLSKNSAMGRSGRVPGTRELVISGTPFVVPYRLLGDSLQILRV